MSEIVFDSVSHAFGDRQVLRGVDLRFAERRVGIIGSNGSGKSTLARMINGLLKPTSGTVTVDGVDAARKGAQVRRKVGFVFTDPDTQIVMPTVSEDLAFSLRRSGLSKEEIAARVEEILVRFRLDKHAEHPAHLLSGGQKQLLAIGAVLIRRPEVVIADEPTTLLDLRNARVVSEALDSMDQQVIVVTHQLALLESFERVIVIDDGLVAFDGSPDDAVPAYRQLVE
ncbi:MULTISPECIES: energy-coupling factor ABC transporter ATP-binding protein [Rhodococcus]|uniref:ATPase component BioM of energizing module of biotin ECF transporter n=2 Tax=Rhodococcus TaxID=1827 RepID=A0A402C9A3_RHOWR|nr:MULTISPECIES: ABC transporter ATP-binding protein [Rhodococcus]KAF0965850.1 Biotin transport ATP-binding protein BioM [Rhodococcus sp. T7]MBV6761340.1 energy-coupling factor ABC transporter ATP-binding protein [Rhodococcus opacus]OUS97640.1 cobalt ABC transporter ATP-binding protein [Rhodococcus sp. NCIMB 12038]QSE89969.1 ABC transporter ATP-binding protein [Rhodococcus pseudokoreensis]GCE40173.1 ATPase component BioM of energizing module of biotin ECF transporter [Rhodococcus wratislaviens